VQSNRYFVQCPAAQDKCHSPDYFYDPTIPAARDFVWAQVEKGYYENNIQIYWLDADEPEQSSGHPQFIYSIGPQEYVGMLFPYYHQQTFYNGMLKNNQSNILMLSRSAWAGSQRWGVAVWSGDIQSTWESLQQQVRIGLNMGLSGIPWWTTDIGGYSGGDHSAITDPVWQELIVRWFQWGAFCPLFRLHGYRNPPLPDLPVCGFAGGPNEVWDWGNTTYEPIATVMKIREQLRPYIMDQMNIASRNGTPVMRPLWFDFPNDPNCDSVDDQFMFGPKYMVAPVIQYQARMRNVYFPQGANWVHWFTGMSYRGGTSVNNLPAPLATLPLFTRS